MTWYSILKKSMALPTDVSGFPDDYSGGSSPSVNWFDSVYEEGNPVSKHLRDTGVHTFLGGGMGAAFETKDPNVVAKYTKDSSEIDAAQWVRQKQEEWGGYLPHIVGIFDFGEISDGVFYLKTEKVEHLDKRVSWLADIIFKTILSGVDVHNMQSEEEKIFIYNIFSKKFKNPPTYAEFVEKYDKIIDIFEFVTQNHLSVHDAYGRNIGIRKSTGEYVLLDLGKIITPIS